MSKKHLRYQTKLLMQVLLPIVSSSPWTPSAIHFSLRDKLLAIFVIFHQMLKVISSFLHGNTISCYLPIRRRTNLLVMWSVQVIWKIRQYNHISKADSFCTRCSVWSTLLPHTLKLGIFKILTVLILVEVKGAVNMYIILYRQELLMNRGTIIFLKCNNC